MSEITVPTHEPLFVFKDSFDGTEVYLHTREDWDAERNLGGGPFTVTVIHDPHIADCWQTLHEHFEGALADYRSTVENAILAVDTELKGRGIR